LARSSERVLQRESRQLVAHFDYAVHDTRRAQIIRSAVHDRAFVRRDTLVSALSYRIKSFGQRHKLLL
jgi:hypothetical protein